VDGRARLRRPARSGDQGRGEPGDEGSAYRPSQATWRQRPEGARPQGAGRRGGAEDEGSAGELGMVRIDEQRRRSEVLWRVVRA
jgi:hypothetical protein